MVRPPASSRERRFLLEESPAAGEPRLASEEVHHALRVLRLGPGDHLVGLDGRGGAWPLRIEAIDSGVPRLVACGEPTRRPAPGERGAWLPWIELAVALPRGGRAEAMVDRLVQLGVAALTPLVCNRSAPQARHVSDRRLERLRRAAAEACKQAGRLWLPAIGEPLAPEVLLGAREGSPVCRLDPRAARRLEDWMRSPSVKRAGTRARPVVLAVGPEGGFDPDEQSAFAAAGVPEASLAPHVLRVETAAEAAAAVAVHVSQRLGIMPLDAADEPGRASPSPSRPGPDR